ncbi:MAG: L-serine ammonia-lyase [Proteobacteria bacterium]|nr:L-serine ammonia-lyase [Pseudomonadota bacterium]
MAAISVFDIFKIGIGPSSSHTVGPMKAARAFAAGAGDAAGFHVTLHGSLAWTGKGHGTDRAILLGLDGHEPETVDPDEVEAILARVRARGHIEIDFDYERVLERHTNGMRFRALDAGGAAIHEEEWFSLGGGFVARGNEAEPSAREGEPPLAFTTSESLLERAAGEKLSIAQLVLRNEATWQSEEEVLAGLDRLRDAMDSCIERGLRTEGVLPGRMQVTRRAPKLYESLSRGGAPQALQSMEWVNAWAIAVNEENAAGGRVVTSPTNGAAGIIPAVLKYYLQFVPGADRNGVRRYLLSAGAIGILYKINASISGAEMGCQGEVGVACSMAAGGLAAALGGSNHHVEEAAEIGMEHNLGLTCDPVGGLVQIPCIERNAMGAVKAINAAKLAMHGDGTHKVSLDQVIETMRQTGLDMKSTYKETSQGGLAVNVPEC